MWVIHEPGTCTKASNDSKKTNHNSLDKKALTAALKAKDVAEDEIDGKVEAILAVIAS